MSSLSIPRLLEGGGSVSGKLVKLGLTPLSNVGAHSFSTHRKVPHTPVFTVEPSLEVTSSVGRGLEDKSGELVK